MQLLGATAGRFWMPHASVASLTSSTTFEIMSRMVTALVQQSGSGPDTRSLLERFHCAFLSSGLFQHYLTALASEKDVLDGDVLAATGYLRILGLGMHSLRVGPLPCTCIRFGHTSSDQPAVARRQGAVPCIHVYWRAADQMTRQDTLVEHTTTAACCHIVSCGATEPFKMLGET